MKETKSYLQKKGINKILIHVALIGIILLVATVVAFFGMQSGTRHSARSVVPHLTGVSIIQAKEIVLNNDLNIIINDSLFVPMYEGGTILDQLPEGGVEVKPGRTIYVTINSFLHKEVEIPYIAERSLRQAINMLVASELEIAEIIYRPDIATNYVLQALYNGELITRTNKLKARVGSGITLHVGIKELNTLIMTPQLITLSTDEAKTKIWEAGLNVGKVEYDSDVNPQNKDEALVYFQSQIQNQSMGLGAKIDLKLTIDTNKVEDARIQAAELTLEIEKEMMRIDSLNLIIKTDSLRRISTNSSRDLSVEDILESENNDNFFD